MKSKKGTWLICLGLLLIAAALFLAAYNIYDERRAEQAAHETVEQLEACLPEESPAETLPEGVETLPAAGPGEVEIPDYVLDPNHEMPVRNIDGEDYIGVLEIPSLGLTLPVMSEWSYPRLKTAPCRYTGSAYLGNLIIAAHNYRSHFGNLKELCEGDVVRFTDMDGNVFSYEVVFLEVLQPTDVDEMESGDWDLTLFTCTVGGKSRVTVRCERTDEDMAGYVPASAKI